MKAIFYKTTLLLILFGVGSHHWMYAENLQNVNLVEISISQENLVMKENGEHYHVAVFDIPNPRTETTGAIFIGKRKEKIVLKSGDNFFEVKIPKVDKPTSFLAKIKITGKPEIEKPFTLKPVKEWTVNFVQHTHTDIGYTRRQDELLPEHLRFIDYALDFCDMTDHYPDDAKFRWTCETSWAVAQYLKSRPKEQIARFLKRVEEGRIEVTGMYLNHSEIVDETGLVMQTQVLKDIKEKGINVTTAMQNDVNGIGWCMPDYFNETGVKYLVMGQHRYRARVPFSQPTLFWWESPSGKRMLAYRAEHYMYGGIVGIVRGDFDLFKNRLTKYLTKLEKQGYPYNLASLQFGGYVIDNSPPSTIACDLVKAWNEKYEWPKIRLATSREFMEYMEENHSEGLPVHKAAWPDWWTDGFGSALNETKASRTVHAELIATKGLLSMAKMNGAKLPEGISEEIFAAEDAVMFYDEHTFGTSKNIKDPMDGEVASVWGQKSAFVWDASIRSGILKGKALSLINPYARRTGNPTITVFNTLNWKRSGLAILNIDHGLLPKNREFRIIDENGTEIATQIIRNRREGTDWGLWVKDIPPMSYKQYEIEVFEGKKSRTCLQPLEGTFENQFYKITLDSEKGTITSLFDKQLGQELLDREAPYKMGEFIYEQLESRKQLERYQAYEVDTVYTPLKKVRTSLTNIEINGVEREAVWNSLHIHGDIPGCADSLGVDLEIRLYNQEKLIEFCYKMRKLPVTSPEGVYVAFPFHLSGGKLFFEAQGGVVSPGVNQLKGTSSDWNTIQNFVSVRNENAHIVFASNDIPLVQFGAINTGRFYYQLQPETSHIYSWVLNNYWTTNFKASQSGGMNWSYYITSSDNTTNSFATQFGWGNRIPFPAAASPTGGLGKGDGQSMLDFGVPNILLVSAKPSGDKKSVILHIRETDGKKTTIDISKIIKPQNSSFTEINVVGEEIRAVRSRIEIEPFEVKFLELKVD